MDGANPTGRLKTHSVKKILYNNKLNPGDKFIIYDTSNQILYQSHITDVGNTAHKYGTWPKWLKIHVIAIEDSGKINYLDSTLKWYDSKLDQPADYFMQHMNSGVGGKKIDIDQYRTTLSSGYSVFQSKVSGKLALLIELEKISGFSCTYGIYGSKPSDETISKKNFSVYWNLGWETENPNVNPSDIVLTKSEWVGKDKTKAGKYFAWTQNTDGTYKLDSGHDGPAIPTAYNDSDYYSASIDCVSNSGSSYSDFINNTCYEVKLKQFLGELPSYYSDTTLAKLNIVRDAAGYPNIEKKYYINAAKIVHDSDFSNTKVYTQKSVQDSTDDNLGLMEEIQETTIYDDIVNNYFHHTIYKKFHDFSIPVTQTITKTINYTEDGVNKQKNVDYTVIPDTSNLIYHYEITPAMPYGLLDEYAVEGYIDFSKIGSGLINLTSWKYFIGGNVAVITIGMDAYPEDNKGIDSIVMEFYDNQGIAASYFIEGKESYSGQFTEVVPLNGATHLSKMRNTDSDGKVIYHCGLEADETDTNVCRLDDNNNPVKGRVSGEKAYLNDAGTIYFGMLYLVKIIVKYCPKDALDNLDTT